jgi:transposase
MESGATESEAMKRRSRTKQERRRIVEETLAAGVSVASVAEAHGVRPSQVFHWRRLYHQGLLGSDAETTALVPVRITDGAGHSRRAAGKPMSGTIQVELENARICIHGAADPASLRVVLESLLG